MNKQLAILSFCSIAAVMILAGSAPEADAAAFMKLGDIKGEATDREHKDWIIIESMSSPIFRSVDEKAKDAQRSRGDTTLGDIVVVRELDKATPKIAESCANGKFFDEVEIHFTRSVGETREEPYLTYKLKDVIVTSYSFHGNAAGDPLPTEEITLGYTEVEWTYITVDPKGERQEIVGSYSPDKKR
ncbi:Hcp family type VI secretion system effector [Nitrosopumilus sp. S4]